MDCTFRRLFRNDVRAEGDASVMRITQTENIKAMCRVGIILRAGPAPVKCARKKKSTNLRGVEWHG